MIDLFWTWTSPNLVIGTDLGSHSVIRSA